MLSTILYHTKYYTTLNLGFLKAFTKFKDSGFYRSREFFDGNFDLRKERKKMDKSVEENNRRFFLNTTIHTYHLDKTIDETLTDRHGQNKNSIFYIFPWHSTYTGV